MVWIGFGGVEHRVLWAIGGLVVWGVEPNLLLNPNGGGDPQGSNQPTNPG